LSVDEREELKQLRKENKNLRMEKEILYVLSEMNRCITPLSFYAG